MTEGLMQTSTNRRRTLVHGAVMLAIYGSAHPARAENQGSNDLQEIVVTATSRPQDVIAVPYSISVMSGDDLKASAVTDLLTLARAVPSLSLVDLGARYATAEVPTIRGINASDISQGSQLLTQSPVGVYLGNSPIDGVIELTDVRRVEVLRGPQGTLYGAGALGGAIRIIPNSPEIGVWDGSSLRAHGLGRARQQTQLWLRGVRQSSGLRRGGAARVVDICLRGGLHRRLWIRAADLRPAVGAGSRRPPGNPVTSPAIFGPGRKSWNDAKDFTGRASLLWRQESFSAELAYTEGHIEGTGGPQVNPDWPGGPNPIDPRVNLAAGGDYRYLSATTNPTAATPRSRVWTPATMSDSPRCPRHRPIIRPTV